MRNFVSKAAAIGILLYSSDLNESQMTQASKLTSISQIKNMAETN